MVGPQFVNAAPTSRSSASAALAIALMIFTPQSASAEPRAGAPIVFSGRDHAARAAPARLQYVSASATTPRAAASSMDEPEVLYGYGSGRHRTAAATIDLRGTLASPPQSDSLGDDAFDNTYEPARSEVASAQQAPVVREPAPAQAEMARPEPAPTGARPDWLERERTGAPYQANGQWFVPTAEPGYTESGSASWYGADFQGRPTASGELFDSEALTAAHPTLPIPSLVQVTNLENGREVIVRVNDRGPFHANRLIDVSRRTAEVLGFERQGQARVNVRYLGPAPRRVQADASPAMGAPPARVAVAEAPPVSPSAPVAVASTPRPEGAYFIQVGAFSNPANVERARTVLGQTGAVSVDLRQSNGAALQRVRVGSWQTRAEAEAARETVASLGYPGAVVAAGR